MKTGNIEVSVMVKLSLWNALKLRLAGIANVMEKDREQEAKKQPEPKIDDIRINDNTGELEICTMIEHSTKTKEIIAIKWGDYETNLLTYTLGMCPGGGEIYPLIRFRQKAIEEAKKIKEEEKTVNANHNHDHGDRLSREGVPDWVNGKIKEAEAASFDHELLF